MSMGWPLKASITALGTCVGPGECRNRNPGKYSSVDMTSLAHKNKGLGFKRRPTEPLLCFAYFCVAYDRFNHFMLCVALFLYRQAIQPKHGLARATGTFESYRWMFWVDR